MNSPTAHQTSQDWKSLSWKVYYNTPNSHSACVDIYRLEQVLAQQILELIHNNKSFTVIAKGAFTEEEPLAHLYFEDRAHEKIKGTRAFGLGYPYIQIPKADNEQDIIAPLFIWQLDIDATPQHNGGWKISRSGFHRIIPNHFLIQYLKELEVKDIEERFYQVLSRGELVKDKIDLLCESLAEELAIEYSAPSIPSDSIHTPSISHKAYLSFFPPFSSEFVAPLDIEKQEKHKGTHVYSPLSLTPEQSSAFQLFLNHNLLWVDGKEGVGKTHLGLHAVLNTLANQQTCLIVSPSVGTLKTYQQELERLELGQLTFLLRNLVQDGEPFVRLLKANMSAKNTIDPIDIKHFQFLSAKLARLKDKLDKAYNSSRKTIFKSYNWTETVGLYLHSLKKAGKELLATQANATDYDYSDEEFESLREAISSCFELFEKTTSLKSALQNLNPGIFLRMEREEAALFVKEKVELLGKKGRDLQNWYINRIDTYSGKLAAHYEDYYQQLIARLITLKDQIADDFAQFGDGFGYKSLRSLKLKKIFSSEAAEMAAAQERIYEKYHNLRNSFEAAPYFDYTFEKEPSTIQYLQTKLTDFEAALQKWRMQQRDIVQEDTNRLSLKTAHPRLQYTPQLEALEKALDSWLEQINESGLYHLPISNKTLTIVRQQRFLDDILDRLEATQRALPEFNNFYDWQNHWLQLDEKSRRLIKVFVKVQPNDWIAAFESWYYHNLLNKHYEAMLPSSLDDIENLGLAFEEIKPLYTKYILNFWLQKQSEVLKKLKRRDRSAYQIINDGVSTYSEFENLIHKAFHSISNAKPVLLTTPNLASGIFAQNNEPFGLIVIDDAHEISLAEANYLQSLGQKVLFVGNTNPASPPPALALVERLDGQQFTLQQLLSKKAGSFPYALQQYSQLLLDTHEPAASAANVLTSPFKHIKLEHLGGRYEEATESNDEEALHIISLLNQIQQTRQRTYPSVGIVCFTKSQRNLISKYLLSIKQLRSTGVELIQQLERNGLMVLDLEELTGQEFDILIVSSTYGAIDLEGNMTGHFHRLDTHQGTNNLNTLLSKNCQQLFWVNSATEETLENALSTEQLQGTTLYATYIQYLEGLVREDKELIAKALSKLILDETDVNPYPQPTAFLIAVKDRLKAYFGSNNLSVLPYPLFGQAPLKIMIGKKGEAIWCLPDGFCGQTPSTDYRWESAQLTHLQTNSVAIQSLVSANWWRNPEQEARRFASWVIQQESSLSSEEEE
jgi:hypothetical protein